MLFPGTTASNKYDKKYIGDIYNTRLHDCTQSHKSEAFGQKKKKVGNILVIYADNDIGDEAKDTLRKVWGKDNLQF